MLIHFGDNGRMQKYFNVNIKVLVWFKNVNEYVCQFKIGRRKHMFAILLVFAWLRFRLTE